VLVSRRQGQGPPLAHHLHGQDPHVGF
jgi:hypothetical protein